MTTVMAEIRELDDYRLSDLWRAGEIDLVALTRECDRRDRAERLARQRRIQEMRWREEAEAQFLEAEAYCCGNLLSAEGMRAVVNPWNGDREPCEPMTLWSRPEREAMRYASEELQNYWLDHPRLTYRQWQLQGSQAAHERAWRDERDLAAMAAPVPAEPTPAPAPRRTVAPMTEGSIARMMRALTAYSTHADNLTARLVRAQHGGIR